MHIASLKPRFLRSILFVVVLLSRVYPESVIAWEV
jgi:hypothetical protein